MKILALLTGMACALPSVTPRGPQRQIDLCAQDGSKFEEQSALEEQKAITAGRLADLVLTIRYRNANSADATLRIARDDQTLLETQLEDFQGPYGWLTSSGSFFTVSWSPNATSWSTKIFERKPDGSVAEDVQLMKLVERSFTRTALRVCSSRRDETRSAPGFNLRAIKWLDETHLLLAADSWSSFTCQANLSEGFIVEPATHSIDKTLTESQLVHLPGVCTWNVVPASRD